MRPSLLVRSVALAGGSRGPGYRLLRRPRPWCPLHSPLSTTTAARDDEGDNQRSVLVERHRVGEGHQAVVAFFTMNRPKNQNALNSELIEELQAAFQGIANDKTVRAVVIRGNGETFCGGHDLYQLHDSSKDRPYLERLFTKCSRLMMTIQRVPQPVIACVHGKATGAGCQLVAACDLAVASTEAKFATSGVKLGLFCATPSVPLSRNIPRKKAFEMLVTGEFIDAHTALDYGLVNRVVPLEELNSSVDALVSSIASKPRVAIDVGKKFFYQQMEKPYAAALDLADYTMALNIVQRDTEEGIAAFVEKRSPDWDL